MHAPHKPLPEENARRQNPENPLILQILILTKKRPRGFPPNPIDTAARIP